MGKAYKNFWSLNTDEAVVAGILRNGTAKHIEVLMPLNAQMKDVDLVLFNTRNKKSLTIQIKGSRAYEPGKNLTRKYGDGSGGWFYFPARVINKSSADYFIFLIYVIEQSYKAGRRYLEPHTITVPTREIKRLGKKYKKLGKGSRYNFFLWVNPIEKTAFDFQYKKYYLSKFLDKSGFNKLNKALREQIIDLR